MGNGYSKVYKVNTIGYIIAFGLNQAGTDTLNTNKYNIYDLTIMAQRNCLQPLKYYYYLWNRTIKTEISV